MSAMNAVNAMSKDAAKNADAAIRRARWGQLPERIRFEDMTQEVEVVPGGAASGYDPEGSFKYYSCLALDLGL